MKEALRWLPTEAITSAAGTTFGDGTRWELWQGDRWLGVVIRWPSGGVESWSTGGVSKHGLSTVRDGGVELLRMRRLLWEPNVSDQDVFTGMPPAGWS